MEDGSILNRLRLLMNDWECECEWEPGARSLIEASLDLLLASAALMRLAIDNTLNEFIGHVGKDSL